MLGCQVRVLGDLGEGDDAECLDPAGDGGVSGRDEGGSDAVDGRAEGDAAGDDEHEETGENAGETTEAVRAGAIAAR